ncbi:MAG: MltA domain-containing protein [Thermoanaerobaculia bacterium]|nr:MltA domain-containing protein [Thermoanaerobaculia bacterium]
MPDPAPATDALRRSRARWRAAAVALAAVAAGAAALALWSLARVAAEPVAVEVEGAPAPVGPQPDRLDLLPADFADLPGWRDDRVAEALPALRASCAAGLQGATETLPVAGDPARWRAVCARLAALPPGDDAALRALLESELEVVALSNRGERAGLLTGYYEPELRGSRRRTSRFRHPLYLAPRDAQVVDLGDFKRDLAGRKITGIVQRGRFRPYWDRGEIDGGALGGRNLEFLWVDDEVALFFLQIQGSGRVVLPDGTLVRVGYAAQNGHDYTAIGRVLIERGELAREEVSLQTIRAWLRAHPERAAEVMRQNRSYVFFRVLPGEAPVGAQGVELTAGRSLAVDDAFLPYGVPLWIETTLPAVPELGRGEQPLARLVVAQDTGGAITGPVRGDLFLGPGREAEEIAGRMKQPLRAWLLRPRGAAAPAP